MEKVAREWRLMPSDITPVYAHTSSEGWVLFWHLRTSPSILGGRKGRGPTP